MSNGVFLMEQDIEYDTRHGGPYDRGSADAYYMRRFDPHYFEGDSYATPRIIIEYDTPEYEAYSAGFREQTDTKDWG
jgi:hypothetical protein